ncbi:uncharacterized protein LOC143062319 isoform X3 [Mytilus galloprovincialis]|uniref:uncharacterized protein LOC143062319 isoform X3 n=1 Tax=Mytilus galloprovincialis TaxID=29158 RepID=UPI003F7BC32C
MGNNTPTFVVGIIRSNPTQNKDCERRYTINLSTFRAGCTKMHLFILILLTADLVYVNSQTTQGYNLKALSVKEFLRFDANHDGTITLSEWETVLRGDDDDGDGIITCDEYVRHSSSPHDIALGVLNQFNGGDCKLTHDEGLVPYHHMDGNGDGILQEIEFINFYIQVLKNLGLTDHGHTTKST